MKAAGVLVRDPEGKVLFVKRSGTGDHGGEWALPGGGIEDGETAEVAARRELSEEIGVQAADLTELHQHELGDVDFTTFAHDTDRQFSPKLNDEHVAHAWAQPEHAPSPLHPGVEKMFADLDAQTEQRFSYGEGDLEVVSVGTEPAPDEIEEIDESEAGEPTTELDITA